MNTEQSRRAFLASGGIAAIGAAGLVGSAGAGEVGAFSRRGPGGPVVISSGNGIRAVERAYQMVLGGSDTAVAVVDGVGLVEADPGDMSVGYGGLPNEDGVVQLDASVMHGPTHKAGSVGALEDTLHAAQVALKVLQTTDHVMIVGDGARQFARAHGFPEKDMLSDRARQVWLKWKLNNSSRDDWLDESERDWNPEGTQVAMGRQSTPVAFTYGTIHCGAVDGRGDVSACTTTSGLSYKIPGRVGDSPIIGAGMFVDNEVGSAGATGRGESVIQSCGAFAVVRAMESGMEPSEACVHVLRGIAKKSRLQKRLADNDGRPKFNVIMYALRKDGVHGSAAMFPGAKYAAADGKGSRKLACASLYD